MPMPGLIDLPALNVTGAMQISQAWIDTWAMNVGKSHSFNAQFVPQEWNRNTTLKGMSDLSMAWT